MKSTLHRIALPLLLLPGFAFAQTTGSKALQAGGKCQQEEEHT